MAKSHTSKQVNRTKVEHLTQLATLETAADIVSQYLKQWTKNEIRRLIHADTIPLIPVGNSLQVGRHRVKPRNKQWELCNDFSEVMESFTNKKSAVIYSILHQTHRFKSAEEILAKDKKLSKLETDFQHYDYSMRKAVARKDYMHIDVIASRYYDTKTVLEEARNDLEKTLRMNKYLKVWEIGKPL